MLDKPRFSVNPIWSDRLTLIWVDVGEENRRIKIATLDCNGKNNFIYYYKKGLHARPEN